MPGGEAPLMPEALTVLGHALVGRQDLPIPEWLFAWGASVVLVVSFVALSVAWRHTRFETNRWRPASGPLARALANPVTDVLAGAIGVIVLGVVVWSGLDGTEAPDRNFSITFVFVTAWLGLVALSVVCGDVFRALNPWRAIVRAAGGLFRWISGQRPPPPLRYPERLGRWPATVGLLAFTWIELVSGWGEVPADLTTAAVVYTVYTLAMQAVFGTEAWTRGGEAFAVYFNLFSRLSVWETRDRVVGLRPPLAGLPRLDTPPGTVLFVIVMIGTVTFDGFSQGQIWNDISVELADAIDGIVGLDAAPKVVATLGLLAGVALIGGFYRLGIDGARSVGGDIEAPELRRAFVHTLVPIAMVYVAAHYLTFLLFEGQATFYLASDPFGEGWDIFGTADRAINYTYLSQNATWYVQVAVVVIGHVAALTLAHDRALALYRDTRLAVRSQYWMLAVMVGFTSLALWLLAQAVA
jgi:hypothetical protein